MSKPALQSADLASRSAREVFGDHPLALFESPGDDEQNLDRLTAEVMREPGS